MTHVDKFPWVRYPRVVTNADDLILPTSYTDVGKIMLLILSNVVDVVVW